MKKTKICVTIVMFKINYPEAVMIGYLGPKGTFSHAAVQKFTNAQNSQLCEYTSIHKLIMAVENKDIDSAIVPIENSLDGSVNSTLDTLAFDADLFICAEYTMKVKENLMALPETKICDIKKIMSHPQPIGQSSIMINTQFPDAVIEYTNSTASAAKQIFDTQDISTATIGPASCAELYGLKILIPECNDEKNNATRFVQLKKSPNTLISDNDKSSFIFTVDNKPGALFKVIEVLAQNKVNMLKIESRPEKKEFGRYIFFIDTDGNLKDENLTKAWQEINSIAYKCKFLGSFQKG